MGIADNHAAKVVPERIFALTVHPMETKLLVFAGDKWGKVGIWDVVGVNSFIILLFVFSDQKTESCVNVEYIYVDIIRQTLIN